MMLICRLLPLLFVVAWLPAQDDRLSEREAEMERRIKQRAEREGVDPDSEAQARKEAMIDEELALRNMTPEERLARNVRTNASAFCRFVADVKPNKLMPGQSGILLVSALLNGQAVLPSPPPMEMIGAQRQGVVTLGNLSFHPADLARQAAGYAGRPVYDNFAIFEIPVSVAPDATIGTKQAVRVDLRFDIYDGVSAQPIGRFVDHVSTEVEVGQALDPVVRGGGKNTIAAAGTENAVDAAPSDAGAMATPADEANDGRVISGQDPSLAVPETPADPEPSLPPVVEGDWTPVPADSGMLPLPVWIGGGVILLVLVLLLARKK